MGTRTVLVRLQTDYELEIQNDLKMEDVKDILIQHFNNESGIESAGINIINRSEDKLKRIRKFEE